LFDASSLVYAIKLKRISVLAGNYVQELTIYEMLNALWKETYILRRMSRKEAESLLDVFVQLLSYLKILDLRGLENEVFKIAVENGLTAYDASYLTLARREKLTLVTEDVKLRNVASTMIRAVSLNEILV
jgi:predicted nucleic acid-binding protein